MNAKWREWMRPSLAFGASLACVAVLSTAQAQTAATDEALYADSYFDSPNWAEDDYGAYDQDFDWETDDEWFEGWNDTDRTAWTDTGERQWDILGYDDAGEWGLLDW